METEQSQCRTVMDVFISVHHQLLMEQHAEVVNTILFVAGFYLHNFNSLPNHHMTIGKYFGSLSINAIYCNQSEGK